MLFTKKVVLPTTTNKLQDASSVGKNQEIPVYKGSDLLKYQQAVNKHIETFGHSSIYNV